VFEEIAFLVGANHMSPGRVEWIGAFLSLFEPFLNLDGAPPPARLLFDTTARLPVPAAGARRLLVGHEIPKAQVAYFNSAGIAFVDLRVSPIRFMAHDNLLAIGSNCPPLVEVLAAFAVPTADIVLEARALSLSLRYRDLSQHQFAPGALVYFTERPVDHDSIHHGDERALASYTVELAALAQRYTNKYVIAHPNEPPAVLALLEGLGFRSATANLYAALASDNVAAVSAIRSGVLSEALPFGKQVHALEGPTTFLWNGRDSISDGVSRFFNVVPDHALSQPFWENMKAGELRHQRGQVFARRPQDLIRRALNNWNSTASGLTLHSQLWQETIGDPIAGMRHFLARETAFRFAQSHDAAPQNSAMLVGRWRWFSGEIVEIEADGHVRGERDFGRLVGEPGQWSINWIQRSLSDQLIPGDNPGLMIARNQYGDGGPVRRLD
jgi:hypothetical protein